MLRLSSRSAALFALLSIAACSSSSTATVPLEDVPARFADGLCSQLEACAGPFADLYLQGADCRQTFTRSTQDSVLPLWQAAIANGTLVYDGHQLDACLTALTDTSCGSLAQRDLDVCDQVFQGQVPAGGSCHVEAECEGARYCQTTTCPGSCTNRKAQGTACTDDSECVSGLNCDGDLGTCERPRDAGESCGGGTLPSCGLPSLCLGANADTGTTGTCRPISEALTAAVGETCDPGAGTLCVDGVSCALVAYDTTTSALSWSCVAGYAAGAACKLALPDACPDGQICDADPARTGSLDGTCVPLPTAGQPCRSVAGSQCASGLVCDDTTCVTPGRLGATCVTSAGCASGMCTAGLCVAPTCG